MNRLLEIRNKLFSPKPKAQQETQEPWIHPSRRPELFPPEYREDLKQPPEVAVAKQIPYLEGLHDKPLGIIIQVLPDHGLATVWAAYAHSLTQINWHIPGNNAHDYIECRHFRDLLGPLDTQTEKATLLASQMGIPVASVNEQFMDELAGTEFVGHGLIVEGRIFNFSQMQAIFDDTLSSPQQLSIT